MFNGNYQRQERDRLMNVCDDGHRTEVKPVSIRLTVMTVEQDLRNFRFRSRPENDEEKMNVNKL